jgi:hypothetical protein
MVNRPAWRWALVGVDQRTDTPPLDRLLPVSDVVGEGAHRGPRGGRPSLVWAYVLSSKPGARLLPVAVGLVEVCEGAAARFRRARVGC